MFVLYQNYTFSFLEFNIYNMKKKTKKVIPLSIDKKLSDIIKENITNRSKYIEWLIYQDLKKNKVEGIEEVLI